MSRRLLRPLVVLAAGEMADCDGPGDEATPKVLDGGPSSTVILTERLTGQGHLGQDRGPLEGPARCTIGADRNGEEGACTTHLTSMFNSDEHVLQLIGRLDLPDA